MPASLLTISIVFATFPGDTGGAQTSLRAHYGHADDASSDEDDGLFRFDPSLAFCTRPLSCALVESEGSEVSALCPAGGLSIQFRKAWDDTQKVHRMLPCCPLAPELLAWLPETPPFPSRNRTCAVVGSSGILKLHPQGRAIDAHDYVIRVNSNPYDGKFAEMAGSRSDLDFVNAPMIHDWGASLELHCKTSESCRKATIAPNPCERSRRLWRHLLKDESDELEPELPSFITVNSSTLVDFSAPPEPSEAVAMQHCAFGAYHTVTADPMPRLLERQSQLARLLEDSTEDRGVLRLVSASVDDKLREFCMREMTYQFMHEKDPAGMSEQVCRLGNFMGGLKATFLALHICEETHLYGFFLRSTIDLQSQFDAEVQYDLDVDDLSMQLDMADARSFPYSYYQPIEEGSDTWNQPSHSDNHDFGLNELLIRRLAALGHLQLHYE
jgi:hypothetical protein